MLNNDLAWIIRDCGVSYYDIADWNTEIASLTTELTEEEKLSKFSKYYLRQIKMPSHENLKAVEVGNPLTQDKMFMPEDFVRYMDSDAINSIHSGYGVMDNGIGFSISRVRWEGITDEKLKFFNENFIPEKDLFYKCWYPGMHMRHYIAGCVEDVGLGMELINFMKVMSPREWAGRADYEYKDPYVFFIGGVAGVSWPLHDLFDHARYCLQGNWFRQLPDGSGKEAIIIFWHGMSWKDGRAVRMIPEDDSISIDHVRAHMNHSIWEYTQVPELIDTFWADNH